MIEMSPTPDTVLASSAEIFGLLAQLAGGRSRRSPRNRDDQQNAREAIVGLFCDQPAYLEPPTSIDRAGEVPNPFLPALGVMSPTPREAVIPRTAPVSGVRQRQHCKCGECKWCLDNARWDRIFNEKFADPSYYGSLKISYNSCLSGAR